MTEPSLNDLKQEMLQLFASMQNFRAELAALRHPKAADDRFANMADQLEEIVRATEEATNTILESVEKMSALIDEHRDRIADADGSGAWLAKLDDNFMEVFQACAFQDITGQRVNKVITSLKYIEDKIDAMAKLWGREGLAVAPLPTSGQESVPKGERLDGLALQGEGTTQDEIDKMFD